MNRSSDNNKILKHRIANCPRTEVLLINQESNQPEWINVDNANPKSVYQYFTRALWTLAQDNFELYQQFVYLTQQFQSAASNIESPVSIDTLNNAIKKYGNKNYNLDFDTHNGIELKQHVQKRKRQSDPHTSSSHHYHLRSRLRSPTPASSRAYSRSRSRSPSLSLPASISSILHRPMESQFTFMRIADDFTVMSNTQHDSESDPGSPPPLIEIK